MGDAELWGLIDAQPVVFPARATAVSMAFLYWEAPPALARELVPEEAFEPDAGESGQVPVTLVLADYRQSDWGPSAFAALTVPVRPTGEAEPVPGVRVCHGVTNAPFADEVMYWALGIPGARGRLDVEYLDDEVVFRAVAETAPVLSVRLPRRADEPGPVIEECVYTLADGVVRRGLVEQESPATEVRPADVRLEVGRGPLADAVGRLSDGRPPEFCLLGEHLTTTIHRPHDLSTDSTSAPPHRDGTAPVLRPMSGGT